VFPALSVIPLILNDVPAPAPDCQPTTIKFPLPVGGMAQVTAGKACGPQDVTWTSLIGGSG
jgi:hypothetical protein